MADYSIPGVNMMLLGASGTGKTYSLRTLPPAGIETFVLFTEPGMRTVTDVPCSSGFHWKYVKPAQASFATMINNAEKINRALDLEALTKEKQWNKKDYQQFMQILHTLNNFKCDRCGEEFGSVDEWDQNRAIVIDSLSGLSMIAMDLATGAKPVKSPADWGTAMANLEAFLNRMTGSTQCHFILIGHLEREKDEVSGGIKLMASTLGQKLAPKLPRNFDDVVLAERDKTKFYWSTAAANVDLKARNLPVAEVLEPSFKLVIDLWQKAGGILTPKLEVVNVS